MLECVLLSRCVFYCKHESFHIKASNLCCWCVLKKSFTSLLVSILWHEEKLWCKQFFLFQLLVNFMRYLLNFFMSLFALFWSSNFSIEFSGLSLFKECKKWSFLPPSSPLTKFVLEIKVFSMKRNQFSNPHSPHLSALCNR